MADPKSIKSGVYCITCVPTGKVYVGQAVDISKRWAHHRWDLNRGRSGHIHLQRAWTKYGQASFEFTVLEWVDVERLTEREQHFIDQLKACSDQCGFNIRSIADSNRGVKLSAETRAKMSAAMKGKKKSAEEIAKMRERATGKKASSETRRRMSEAGKGRRHTEESREKMSALAKGRTHSDETRAKLSAIGKAQTISPEHVVKLHEGRARVGWTEESRAKIGASKIGNTYSLGRTCSEETRAKIAKAHQGMTHGDEARAKISRAKTGAKPSDEARAKMSASAREAWQRRKTLAQ